MWVKWVPPSFARPYVSQIVESRSIVKGLAPGRRAGRPGSGQERAAHGIELADVTPTEAAQERAQSGWGLHPNAQDPLGAAGPERSGVVDAVTAGER